MTTTNLLRTHRFLTPDGRAVAVEDRGPTAGPAVVLLHSAPGSRVFDPDAAATAAAGVRLVTIDRPGYGESSPLPAGVVPSMADRADDVVVVLDALGIAEAAVAGWSAGGVVALGTAARHPERVRRVALLGTPAPHDEVPWVPEAFHDAIAAMKADPGSALAMMIRNLVDAGAAVAPGGEPDPGASVGMFSAGPADAATLAADTAGAARGMAAAAFAQGPVGVATDIVAAQVVPWGFDPAAIGVPVDLFYGEQDVMIPLVHGGYWADRLADAHLHVVADAGHLVPMVAWADVLATLA